MDKQQDILEAAERIFERRGFHAVPIDQVIADACVSPRTLYKYFPGKTELAAAVLERRHQRFLKQMRAREASLEGLFAALYDWLDNSPAHGCLFLRALGEYGEEPVTPVVARHKKAFRRYLGQVAKAQGQDTEFADALFVLTEGATALAPKLGARRAVESARRAAMRLAE